MNQQTLAGNGVMQMENTGGLSSYHQTEGDQGISYRVNAESLLRGTGGTASAPASASSNAALALGMLARSMNNGNAYNAEENQSNEQTDRNDHYQSG